ncbi:hypothetical protein APQ14_10320 [Vibrio toranzoniae]|jgi:hypothetical protein|uniref:Uncharacterized protein n=1 Tax=Vibrio toranzoniae TaxID=1194427 RepID=A0A109D7U6_9VIBR|nr:hypothetical protein [Vibrio toranzoniae]KWU00489.1 hypothetical protein APQ14_10320 [Vibrio toranzoniae]SBS35565.1 hypothetical protein VTO7225_02267 [Vibrio toranzoniae]|tara:strand:+ start:3038 stop:3619 length:582 start_codon:yes stop_codon:yes gene_type:complete
MVCKSDAASRQEYVTIRRKESGLVTKKFHLHQDSVDKLYELGLLIGYNELELKKNENLSAILEVCIDTFTDHFPKNRKPSRNSIRLQQLHKTIKFKEDEGYTDASIAEFLKYWDYQTPILFKNMTTQDGMKMKKFKLISWSDKAVARIKSPEYLKEQTEHLNKRPKRTLRKQRTVEPQKRKKRDFEDMFRYEI